ncbi:unknown [Sinorhizobium phage PBC5]|nr:unknown [Sinorhizobium phage PBC5]
MRAKARLSAMPSELAMKDITSSPPLASVAPSGLSKKYEGATLSASLMACSLLAPTRLAPFSYFWTCWKVMPRCAASVSWLMPMMLRRSRMRAPTCVSIGFGFFGDGLVLASIVLSFWVSPGLGFSGFDEGKDSGVAALDVCFDGAHHLLGAALFDEAVKRSKAAAEQVGAKGNCEAGLECEHGVRQEPPPRAASCECRACRSAAGGGK